MTTATVDTTQTQGTQETQSQIIQEGLERQGMNVSQLAKLLGMKTGSFIYNIIHERTTMQKPETIERLAEILEVDPDRMYIAANKLPPDIEETVLEYPQLIQVVRNLRQRLEDKTIR